MLVQIGKQAGSDDVVDLLIECHGRIRKFLAFARALAEKPEAAPGEVRAVAGQVRRYFAVALPLHIADEEHDILPRLTGASAAVDRALATMHGEHDAHAAEIARLVAVCAQLERDPAQLPIRAGELAAAAAQVTADMQHHLELEERVLFPAIRHLAATQREEIRNAMRTRREAAP